MANKLKYKYQANQQIGMLTILEANTTSIVKCICTCGKRLEIKASLIANGNNRSCGCSKKTLRAKTNMEKYGVENISQVSEIKNKKKEKSLSTYGVEYPSQDPTVRQKCKQTLQDRYGVENPSQHKEFQEAKIKTSLQNWGVEYPIQSLEVQKKKDKTNLLLYGTTTPFKNKKIKTKILKSIQEKYGVDNVRKSPIIKAKIRETKLTKYGYPGPRECFLSDGRSLREVCDAHDILYPHAYKILHKYGEELFLQYCKKGPQQSSLELLFTSLLSNFIEGIKHYNRSPEEFNTSYRPDFRLQKDGKTLYVNVDGLFWHSTMRVRSKEYHLSLQDEFNTHDTRLMQFREDEIINHPEIVLSMIKNYFGESIKLNARQGMITSPPKEVSNNFFEENHLKGSHKTATAYGLCYEGDLKACISIRRKGKGISISRFATANGYIVRGAFSRLLKYTIKVYDPEFIESYCDLRYATGDSYVKMGFEQVGVSLGWEWTDFKRRYNRRKCKANMDDRNLSQKAHSKELGWVKIYDAGQAKYTLNIKTK